MTLDIVLLCSVVIGALFVLIPMKELKREYFLFAAAGLSVVIFVFSLKSAKPIFQYIEKITNSEASFYLKILVKILGISIITNLTSEFSKDMGAESVSGKVEFAGKIAILLAAVPVYDNLFRLVESIV